MLHRITFTVLWSIGAFLISQFLVGFFAGLLFFNLAMAGNEAEDVSDSFVFIFTITTFSLILAITLYVAILGVRGHLPGTRN